MADNEKNRNVRPPRRNPQLYRPPPGVQKAIQTLGVRDLREILDKKRQEQGESQDNKSPDPKRPPPDPSYNFLKDPSRDRPKPPQKRSDHNRAYEKPINRDRESHPQYRYKNDKYPRRDWEAQSQQKQQDSSRDKTQKDKDVRQQDNKENNNNDNKQEVLKKDQNPSQSEGAPKKELRFSDTPEIVDQRQFAKTGRHSLRGRKSGRGSGIPRESKEEKIENPVNIKIELSIETGHRNCTLDENTKIPDIKHVPDKVPQQRSPRGSRGGRGNYRGRGRGRGSFRGRGAFSHRGVDSDSKIASETPNNAFNMEKLQQTLPESVDKGTEQSVENGTIQSDNSNYLENTQGNNSEQYEYEQENDEFNDANENYDNEFSSEYQSEYNDDLAEPASSSDNSPKYESSPESQKYNSGSANVEVDPNIKETITITSSKFQDGEVKRSVEVKETNN